MLLSTALLRAEKKTRRVTSTLWSLAQLLSTLCWNGSHPWSAPLRRPVNPTVYSHEELKAKLQADNHSLKAIQKGKNTFLIGDEHEFRQLR